jgi:hypothetical protein
MIRCNNDQLNNGAWLDHSLFIFISAFRLLGLWQKPTKPGAAPPADLACLLWLPLLIKGALIKQKEMINENRYKRNKSYLKGAASAFQQCDNLE